MNFEACCMRLFSSSSIRPLIVCILIGSFSGVLFESEFGNHARLSGSDDGFVWAAWRGPSRRGGGPVSAMKHSIRSVKRAEFFTALCTPSQALIWCSGALAWYALLRKTS